MMPSTLDALKQLLLREWDPLGLAGRDGSEGHYDPYAVRVFEMLGSGADARVIAAYFNSIVASEFSLTSNPEREGQIAAKAVAIHGVVPGETRPNDAMRPGKSRS
jgi:hypothetical protein